MALDKSTRNALAGCVGRCRKALTDNVRAVFEGEFDLQPGGSRLPVDRLGHLTENGRAKATLLREWQDHLATLEKASDDERRSHAFDRMVLETAFTALNRLVALRLCEERGYVVECVRRGSDSEGFRLFERLSGGVLGSRGQTYRLFLTEMYRDLAVELGVLFDTELPQSIVFPGSACIDEVLGELGSEELADIWQEDETIGWVFQYFNSDKERRKMRDASAAPRNSRELAVRNQFFTPRHVVEFLVDNTLGRIWYEMRRGETRLAEECKYLVYRPSEIFLERGQEALPEPETVDLGREELLALPVYVPWRDKMDPRDMRVLDPACGSGHFLLYAFEVLAAIHEECWADAESPKSALTGSTLSGDYPNLTELKAALPRLIIENNLFGVDIDVRATQVASLALWLRAQRYAGDEEVRLEPVTQTNIVCAEPIGADDELLAEFTKTIRPTVLGQLVHAIVATLQSAGELGVLLKAEEQMGDLVADAKKQWQQAPSEDQLALSPELERHAARQEALFDVSGVTDEAFWLSAESAILSALSEYASRVQEDSPARRILFSTDATEALGLLDICRRRYDVVLMNPPFGQEVASTTEVLRRDYSGAHGDLLCAFVARGQELLASTGLLGAITSRSCLMRRRLEVFRREWLVPGMRVLLDLGGGIMDDAMVQACAYVLQPGRLVTPFWAINARSGVPTHRGAEGVLLAPAFPVSRQRILRLPAAKVLYDLPLKVDALLRSESLFEPTGGTAREGMKTFDNTRFLRLKWEVAPTSIGPSGSWEWYAKGGTTSAFYGDLHLVLGWCGEGDQLKEVNKRVNGSTAQVRQASKYWRTAGCTYSRRGHRFAVRLLPAGCVFSDKGPAILMNDVSETDIHCTWLNSSFVRGLVQLQANASDYHTGTVKALPYPAWDQTSHVRLRVLARELLTAHAALCANDETDTAYRPLFGNTFLSTARRRDTNRASLLEEIGEREREVDALVLRLYGLDGPRDWICDILSDDDDEPASNGPMSDEQGIGQGGGEEGARQVAVDLVSFCVGASFGRWDARLESEQGSSLAFEPSLAQLPACSPAMLTGDDGLPLLADPEGYPIRVSWGGVLVDDPGLAGGGAHADDIASRVRELLVLRWGERAEEIEHEACDLLGSTSLRDFFRKPSGFFAEHLKRYSKSRRQAPIYWPLATASGSYTLWLYYPRLDEDLLFRALNRYLEPKMSAVGRRLAEVDTVMPMASGREASELRKEREELVALQIELAELRAELLRVAALPYKPDLNDGVLICAAPLAKVFRLTKWRKDLEKCWEKLEGGVYDWAHLAYAVWPERVLEACRHDRSIAIAQGVEEGSEA